MYNLTKTQGKMLGGAGGGNLLSRVMETVVGNRRNK